MVSVLVSALALANLFLTSPAMAVEARCPPKAMTALDARGLQRRQPFDETHPMYDLPQSLVLRNLRPKSEKLATWLR